MQIFIRFCIFTLIVTLSSQSSFSWPNILDAVKQEASNTIERKARQKTREVIDDALDGNSSKKRKNQEESDRSSDSEQSSSSGNASSGESKVEVTAASFFPQGQILFREDFENTALGSIPSGFSANGGGEVVSLDGRRGLKLQDGFLYPKLDLLPEEYVLEFDLITDNFEKSTEYRHFYIQFLVEQGFKQYPSTAFTVNIPLLNHDTVGDYVSVNSRSRFTSGSDFDNKVDFPTPEYLNRKSHVTLVCEGERLRFYFDNTKVLDIASALIDNRGRFFRFGSINASDDGKLLAVDNLVITQNVQDAATSLSQNGSYTTNEITFLGRTASFADNPETLFESLSQYLQSNQEKQLLVMCHTDPQNAAADQMLTKERAEAIKLKLIQNYGIEDYRIITVGKGGKEPLVPGSDEASRSKNNRIDFKAL